MRGLRVTAVAVASNGYPASAAGAEVSLGEGVIVAARTRQIVWVPNVPRSRVMQAAIAGAESDHGCTSTTTRRRRSTSSRARSASSRATRSSDEAGDFALVPRGVPHTYLVRSERARLFVTFSPAGFEEAFVELGVPVEGSEPPADSVFPGPDEAGRVFAAYGCEIVGPPPTL